MRYPPVLVGLCEPFDSLTDFDRYLANGSRPFVAGISGPNPGNRAFTPLFGWAVNEAEARAITAHHLETAGYLDNFLDDQTPVSWFPGDKIKLLRAAFAEVLAEQKAP